MPSLGPDMEAGTLVQWRIKPGDPVKHGDIVALVETDKGIIDVEIFADGVVDRLLVAEGAHVAVGTLLAQLNDGKAAASQASQAVSNERPASSPAPSPVAAQPAMPTRSAANHETQRRKVSPAARARARELGVDLDRVTGTGMGSAITMDDVLRAAQASKATVAAVPEPAHDMRQIIAHAMSRSKREIPHYYLSLICSFANARAFLDEHNATADIESRLLPSVVLLKAVARAAKALPEFNGFYKNDAFETSSDVHLGVAIAMRGGRLVAPAILNADQKSLGVMMSEVRDLATRVRSGHMRSRELSMPTITVTSFAEEQVDCVIPVIYPPQVAIVGIGSIRQRPWVVEGQLRAQLTVSISLAADHRVTDGRAGTRFLASICNGLQAPEQL